MKNKNYLILISLVLAIGSACNKDVLEEIPRDFLSPQTAYALVPGIEQGIIGMYSDVRDQWYRNGGLQSYGLFGLGTDVGYDGETPGGQRFLTNYVTSITPQGGELTTWWRYFYAEIQQANNIIEGINNIKEAMWADDAQKMRLLAEARFFRAWVYDKVVTLWGDVPLITEVINSAKTDFVRTPKADVYKQIEDDLVFAAANLPGRGEESAPGRLTKAAALQVLTKVYLAQSKFQLAADASTPIIESMGYALMTERFGSKEDVPFGSQLNPQASGDVFSDLFRKGNQNLKENTESIWVMQFEPDNIGGKTNYWAGIFGPRPPKFGNTPDGFPNQNGPEGSGGVARSRGTSLVFYYVWNSDWDNDIRNAENNIHRKFYFNNPASIYNGQLIDFSLYPPGVRNPIKDTCNFIYPYFMKMWGSEDFYAMRLAETYLLRAEAYLGLGNKDLAAADINVVRNRAHATPVLAADVDIDYILDERVRELYGEEMRMITLMRRGKLVERTRKYNDNPIQPGAGIQDFNNLWPIPQSQIDLNRDAKMEQNPGY